MGTYLVRRTLLMILTLFGISVVIFTLLRVVPGNVVDILFEASGFVDEAEKAQIEKHWTSMSRTGVWASLFCARAAMPHLVASSARPKGEGGGRLILITSPSGVEGSANIPLYSPAKAAQRAIAKSLAREWGEFGITVNCIGPVAGSPALLTAFDRNPALQQAIEARTPLGRVGDITDDIGSVALFLASDDSSFVTGQTIICDGGSFLGL